MLKKSTLGPRNFSPEFSHLINDHHSNLTESVRLLGRESHAKSSIARLAKIEGHESIPRTVTMNELQFMRHKIVDTKSVSKKSVAMRRSVT